MKYQHIHFVGIKGVGMTPLAIIAKEAKCKVTGSDVAGDFITKSALDKADIVPFAGFLPEHIAGSDLIITTGAHGGYDNPEVVAAKEKNIPVFTHGEALGKFMEGELFGRKMQGIAIAGTHGKTTTTAILATLLMQHGYDPSYVIGTSSVSTLQLPGHYGTGIYCVVEADEYATDPKHDKKARFLWLSPRIAVITNIEHDHPDIYPTIDDVRKVFLEFANRIDQSKGILIACGDDPEVRKMLKEYEGSVRTYGFSQNNDYVIKRVTVSKEQTFFRLEGMQTDFGEFSIKIIGEHNVLNAVAALIVGLEVGLSLEKIKKSLVTFAGAKRRFELVGKLQSGALLYDDYAHHPTEIKKTLKGAREFFPHKKIIPIFQPHTYTRTKELFSEFARSFSDADSVLLTDIYASLREAPDPSISVAALALQMKEHAKSVIHLPLLSDVVEYLNKEGFGENTVLITMGAGDIYTIKDRLTLQ